MNNIGLILEGGGMRGVYTAGILDFFMDKNLYFPYVSGVSMGACNAASYVSKQRGRTKAVTVDLAPDPRYISIKNFIKHRSIFNMDFIFDEVPNKLVPFDFETFSSSPQKLIIGTTDCLTGNEVYFDKTSNDDILNIIRASSSLPFISKPVKINNKILMDGGISDPIPIKKSISDGNKKNVIILTRDPNYVKAPFNHKWLLSKKYSNFKGLCKSLLNRHKLYNETLAYIKKLENEGSAFVIRPQLPPNVRRVEKNQKRLNSLYLQGYKDAEKNYENLINFLN
ncbi:MULTISPECIES: patatin-like phospholipase family protein [Clostridium]|uniref:patatin-like phospholipase family protein n=1 Tax=Clostridium TaxID=1485 RepID=UPI000826290E|nr:MULTISPECIES: patatin-like phospholipase family protein [Clostridium]PJI09626.1 patatin family protein [Clostridium sp. CT7]